MKFTLTIEGDTNDKPSVSVLALIASIAEGTVPNIPLFTSNSPGTSNSTDEGDDEAPGTIPATIQPGEVDANGLPWDERIHSGAKTKTAAGNWRGKKNVDAATVTAVEAELRSRTAAPAAPVAAPEPVAATIPAAPVAAPPVASPPPMPVAAPPVAAPPVAAPPVAAPVAAPSGPPLRQLAVGELDFPGLMQVISTAMTGQKLPEAKLAELCAIFGIAQIAEVANDPTKIAQSYNWLFTNNLLVGTP